MAVEPDDRPLSGRSVSDAPRRRRSMTRSWRWFAHGTLLVGIVGCSFLKKQAPDAGEGGAEASASVEVEAAPAPLAANEADVTRYPQEKPTSGSATVEEATASLHTETGAKGNPVAVLKKGTAVDKIAEHEGFTLVVADDPKDSSRKVMGWTGDYAFVLEAHRRDGGVLSDAAAPAHGDAGPAPAGGVVCVKQTGPGTCPAGFVVSNQVCRTPCTTAADCKGPDPKCNAGKCFNGNGCK
jgi:hypothetical protein